MAESVLPPPKKLNIEATDAYIEWKAWIESFNIYAVAVELGKKSDGVQTATMLHCLWPAVQRIFRTLPGKKESFKEAVEALEGYFAPRKNVVAERHKFRSRKQNADETIDAYLTSLRELVKTCEFGALEDEMLRDQIVEKCCSKQLRERLLAQEELHLAKTLRIARSSESAIKEARLLSGHETKDDIINIDRLSNLDKRNRNYNSENFKCYRCGGVGHKPADCRAISMKCYNCQRLGHFARVCRSKGVSRKPYESQKTSSKKTKARRNVRAIRRKDSDSNESCIESESEDEQILFMEGQDSPVQVTINGRKIKMVADTGCRQNIISSQLYREQFKEHPLESTTKQFVAYGQKVPLTCLGRFKASLKAGMMTIHSFVYVIKGQAESLLGRKSCFDLGIFKQVKFVKQNNSNSKKINDPKLNSLVNEYNDLFHGLGQITNYSHKIKLDPNVKRVSQRLRRIPLSQIEQVNDEIDKMLKDDVIEEVPEPSPWVSNLVVVPKASGGLRVCCDFRELNKAIVRERYVLPKVEDTLDALNGSKYFAKIDARSGFFQLTLSEECRYLTTFITNKGCFRFKRVPFGLTDISETFQKVMEEILFGLKGVEISVDDVIVHAVTIYQLISRLREVFERCRERNLKLNPKKCEFGLTQIPVLGHVVSAEGIQPDPVKTKAIQEAPPPANVAELRSFLGVCGYVSKFIPNYAELIEPLRRLTRQGTSWAWDNEQAESFEELKRALSNEPVLACFKLGGPTVLVTDASPVGLGGVLLQKQAMGELKPVAYISRSLTPTEARYSQIERED